MVRLPTRTVGEAHSLPLRRSRLGAPFGGAAERSEAEGVSWDEWYVPLVFTVPCRVANLATRRSPVRSTLASPEGVLQSAANLSKL